MFLFVMCFQHIMREFSASDEFFSYFVLQEKEDVLSVLKELAQAGKKTLTVLLLGECICRMMYWFDWLLSVIQCC